jgi:hypothetical protein
MAQRGIQEPSLLATNLIQDAGHYQKPLQLVSFDMEKAFDRVGHHISVQALRAFGVPEIMIMATQHYMLVAYLLILKSTVAQASSSPSRLAAARETLY